MRLRLGGGLLVVLASLAVPAAPPAAAQVAPEHEVVALIVEGTGFGHGRGLSQWGAYGRAVNGGQTWTQILDAYYGGTTLGTVATSSRLRVRLLAHDGDSTVGVISPGGSARWGSSTTNYSAIQARATTAANRYDVWARSTVACPASTTTGWSRVAANVAGPITFATTVNEASAPAGSVLGLCSDDGSVTHYRGRIQLTSDNAGNRRVVNDVLVESYLRGVVPREVSTSWGNAGGGRGMNALRAQAVAARSYALSQNRYASSGGYATTCDTQTCQVYGGAARRSSATAATASNGVCESGNATFECVNTNRAIAETAGRVRRSSSGAIVSTEFSASNGPRTAGGTFPAINDPFDDVPQNPNHRWTRIVDGDLVAAAYGLGTLTAATSEADPATPFVGVWDNRLRLTGTGGTVLVGNLTFRSAYGLPSHGFTVRAVTRGVVASNSMRMIGDSVGLSMTETSTSELRALLDGVFTSAGYDNVTNRCTSGCGLSGVGAATSVPVGTDLVLVELGYNSPTSDFGARIDAMMAALQTRQVERVVWINLSARAGRADFTAANQALTAAQARWPDLFVLDWASYSAGSAGNRNRWFAGDGIHLTATGQAEMARFVRDRLLPLADFPVGSSIFAWDRETGAWAIRSMSDWTFRLRTQGTITRGYTDIVGGDFNRDGSVDEVFIWNRVNGSWVVQSTTNYLPSFRWSGSMTVGYDEIIVGDFDGDGFRNDLFIWNHDNGAWVVQSMSGFRPTYRSSGAFSAGYDVMAVGDLDDDGRLDDSLLWDTDGGLWVAQSWTTFRPTFRRGGRWTVGYDAAINGDWNRDGNRDDFVIVNFDNGSAVVHSWSSFAFSFRGSAQFSSTFDLGVSADLNDDRRHNELLLFDRDAAQWQIYTYRNDFTAVLARAGSWPAGYDILLDGVWG
jgi:peptidoglycan hydrolase-like amidase